MKVISKPRMVLFEGREDDTNTTTSSTSKSVAAIEVKQIESSEKSLFENVGRTTKRSNILHRGRDGKERELCGPDVAGLASCTSKRYCSGDTRVKCMRLRTNNKKINQSDSGVYLNEACMKSYSHGLVRTGRPDGLHANHEPVLEEIIPTFRTPPGKIRLGSFLISIISGERLLF